MVSCIHWYWKTSSSSSSSWCQLNKWSSGQTLVNEIQAEKIYLEYDVLHSHKLVAEAISTYTTSKTRTSIWCTTKQS